MKPTVSYDKAVNAAYLRFSRADVKDSEEVAPGVVFDYDEEGRMVGMEILDATSRLPPDLLTEAA